MTRQLCYYTFLICFTTVLTKNPEPDLPPCPTNFQFLPQNLPMHCKMPSPPNYPAPPFPPQFPPYFSGPVIGKQAEQSPAVPDAGKLPVAPAVPPAPVGVPMPMGMGPPMPMGMPGMPMGMPGMPMAMPMLGGPPQSKLPVIVMPFYSPDPSYKNPKAPGPNQRPRPYKRKIRVVKHSRHHHSDSETSSDRDTDSSNTDTDTDTDSTDSDQGRWNWKSRRSMRRRKKIRHERKKEDYLTPILQYVSKDGYVIFEKQISKGEAKNWLGDSKDKEKGDNENSQAPNKNISKDEGDEHEPMKNKLINKAKLGEPDQSVVVKYNKRVRRVKPDQQTKDSPRKTHLQ